VGEVAARSRFRRSSVTGFDGAVGAALDTRWPRRARKPHRRNHLASDLLRETRRSATCIGPMAAIPAACGAQTNDLTALERLLGAKSCPQRACRFSRSRRRRRQRGRGLRPTAPSKPVTEDRRNRDRAATSPRPANIASIESNLIRYIGPIARILVKRELEKYETLDNSIAHWRPISRMNATRGVSEDPRRKLSCGARR